MSLLTRTFLLLSLMISAIAIAAAYEFGSAANGSPVDKLVAERNMRRALAYRTVFLQGGSVATSFPGNSWGAASAASDEARPGSKVTGSESVLAEVARLATVALSDMTAAVAQQQEGTTADRQAIDAATVKRRAANNSIRQSTEGLLVFGGQLSTYAKPLTVYTNLMFNLDYDIQRMSRQRDAERVEVAQLVLDAGRLRSDLVGLEDAHLNLSRKFERVVTRLANYAKYAPDLPAQAEQVASPWVRGTVVDASANSAVGLVWLSVGRQDGVEAGQKFAVYRDDKFVAYVRVDNVERNRAQASLLTEFRGNTNVVAGDTVRAAVNFAASAR